MTTRQAAILGDIRADATLAAIARFHSNAPAGVRLAAYQRREAALRRWAKEYRRIAKGERLPRGVSYHALRMQHDQFRIALGGAST